MNKRIVFVVLFLVFFLNQVSASELLESDHESIQNTILPKGIAKFYLTLDNNQNFEDTFRVVKPSVYWEWLMDADSVSILKESSETIEISFSHFEGQEPGDYGLSMDIVSKNNESVKTSEFFEIKVVSYDQALSTELISSENINPNKENLFRVNIRNNYDLSIDNLSISFLGDYFSSEKNFSIRPYETVELEFPIEFEGTVEEGDSVVSFKIFHDDELVVERENSINIGYFTDVKGIGTPEDSFLYNKESIIRSNNGNTISHENIMKKLSSFEKFFTSTNPSPDEITKEDGFYILMWSFDLQPDETKTVIIETNYRYFVFACIFIILLILFLYYFLKRDISLEKRVVSMKKGDDGFYSMNVILSLKNKTLKNIKNIKVMDRLGGRVEKTFNFGTLEPKTFKTGSGKSTKLVWIIGNLEKKGEVILQYTMRYKPHVIKSVPSAVAKYLRHGRPVYVKSNRAEIFS
jgi:hypothetical protein|tara:strand:+ start:89 stop:1480 length:1392 start_codon:yes stop_codon:yes gene_type:complete